MHGAPAAGAHCRGKDAAFCFTYAETLEALRENGAELCFFSPLADTALPDNIGGLYLPGGYPELYAARLAANAPARRRKSAVQGGLPTVAECGGFLYLGRTLQDADGTPHPMAGVLPGQGFKVGRLVRFGYARLTARADSMLFRAGRPCPSTSSITGTPPKTAMRSPLPRQMGGSGRAALPMHVSTLVFRISTGRVRRCRSALRLQPNII